MREFIFTVLFIPLALSLWGQELPHWLNEQRRAFDFPNHTYITGFAMGDIRSSELLGQATERIKTEAQGVLSKNIRVKINDKSRAGITSISSNDPKQYKEIEEFSKEVITTSDAEVVGIKVESYYDKKEGIIYAFAYANRYELAGYYKANIGILVKQAESALHTAMQLEESSEKAKASKQCEEAMSILAQVRYAQDLLMAINAADSESLQQDKSETLRNAIIQMQAQLTQGVYVYVESREEIFGKTSNIIANKLKAILAVNGCSFVDDPAHADLKFTLSATTRKIGNKDGAVKFCYADVVVNLYSNFKQTIVFNDEFAKKGGSTNYEAAGRKAMESAVAVIAEKVMPWIKN